jgi:hypothetical protein
MSLGLTMLNLERATDSIIPGSLVILWISTSSEEFSRRKVSISDAVRWYWSEDALNSARDRSITVAQIPSAAKRIIPKTIREGISSSQRRSSSWVNIRPRFAAASAGKGWGKTSTRARCALG